MPAAKTRTRPPRKPPPVEEAVREQDNLDSIAIPETEKRNRTPKLQKLESAVAGLYIMTGGALSTLPEQVGGARVKMIGLSVAQSSDEIAEAWIDLAEDDRRVLKALESLTSFSGWGKVIGVHLIAIGSAVPGIAAAMPQSQAQSQQPMGNGAPDVQTAMVMAEMFRQAQSQQRQRMEEEPAVMEDIRQQQQQQPPQQPSPRPQPRQGPPPQPRQTPVTRPGRNAGIPSAADLGVSIPDASVEFPTAGPENIRG
jgi:hypothetical protein